VVDCPQTLLELFHVMHLCLYQNATPRGLFKLHDHWAHQATSADELVEECIFTSFTATAAQCAGCVYPVRVSPPQCADCITVAFFSYWTCMLIGHTEPRGLLNSMVMPASEKFNNQCFSVRPVRACCKYPLVAICML
jgi:hypothetical protein